MLSTADWDAPLWTNKQQIAVRLAEDFAVLYVEPLVAMGSGKRSLARASHWRDPSGVTVYRPASALPFGNKLWSINKTNARLLAGDIRQTMWDRGFSQAILWCYPPTSQPFLEFLPHVLSCYDCVDEYSAFPGAWVTATKRMEHKLLQSVDAVFTTARSLFDEKKRHNPHTYFVPNVADFALFNRAATAVPSPLLRDLPRPVIGFVGALNYKIDTALLEALFKLRPDWSFVLVGPDRGLEVQRFLAYPNARFLGRKEIEELPSLMAGFDACMIPYKIDRYTHGVLPLKFFEYLATGKPVVATRMAELQNFAPLIDLVGEAEEFVDAVESRLQSDPHRDRRLAIARENSWEKRIGTMLGILETIRKEKQEGIE